MARSYFGTDGIRGPANQHPMTSELALKVGMAAGRIFSNGGNHRHRVVIGKDTRLSGYMIESALVSGFTSVGMRRHPARTDADAGRRDADALPACRYRRDDLGLAQSPLQDNGIKIFDARTATSCPTRSRSQIEDACSIQTTMSAAISPKPMRLGRAKRIERASPTAISSSRRARSSAATCDFDGLRDRHRQRQRRRLQGRARGPVGARRRRLFKIGVATRRLQHQPRLRFDLPRGADRKKVQRGPRRHRDRARRRRRPADHRRRDMARSSTATS